MTVEAQRIKIAEACGWTEIKVHSGGYMTGTRPRQEMEDVSQVVMAVRLYTSSLDAMHEAEKAALVDGCSLTNGRVTYCNKLMRICGSHAACVHATAAQRAEAFLKTIGAWEEPTA